MKCLVIIAAILVPIFAHAATSGEQKSHDCMFKSLVINNAMQWRDNGLTPQDTFERTKNAFSAEVNEAFMKKAINLVYFDQRFAFPASDELQSQLYMECMNPSQPYQPLK